MVAQLSYQSPWVSLALELDSNTPADRKKNGFITEKFLVVISNQLLSCRMGHGVYTVGAKQFCKVNNMLSTEMRLYSRTTATTFAPRLGAVDKDPRKHVGRGKTCSNSAISNCLLPTSEEKLTPYVRACPLGCCARAGLRKACSTRLEMVHNNRSKH